MQTKYFKCQRPWLNCYAYLLIHANEIFVCLLTPIDLMTILKIKLKETDG